MRWIQATTLGLLLMLWSPASGLADADAQRGRGSALGATTAVLPRSACHTCHGLHGVGDSSGAFPRPTGQSARYLCKQLKDYASGERQIEIVSPIAKVLTDQHVELQLRFWKEGKRHNSLLGVTEHIAKQLPDEEVKALAAYFASLRPPDSAQKAAQL
jgi:cytochrome c553